MHSYTPLVFKPVVGKSVLIHYGWNVTVVNSALCTTGTRKTVVNKLN